MTEINFFDAIILIIFTAVVWTAGYFHGKGGSEKKKEEFWVEIQHWEPFDEKNLNEHIFIQRNREDLDNVGEVFKVCRLK